MLLLKYKQLVWDEADQPAISLINQPSNKVNKFENGRTKFLIVYPSQYDESVVTSHLIYVSPVAGDTYPSGRCQLHAIWCGKSGLGFFYFFSVTPAFLFAVESQSTKKGRVGRHQSNLLRTIKFDLSSRNFPFVNTDDLYSLRFLACDRAGWKKLF